MKINKLHKQKVFSKNISAVGRMSEANKIFGMAILLMFLPFAMLLHGQSATSSELRCAGKKSKVQIDDFSHSRLVPIEEVKRTDKLQGVTRMSGNCMVLFDLEVLSTMLASNPGEGSILAEIKSELFRETGVLAGMSGSPVYLNRNLVGAIAYTVPNLKKPIVGITPIHAMLRVKSYLQTETNASATSATKRKFKLYPNLLAQKLLAQKAVAKPLKIAFQLPSDSVRQSFARQSFARQSFVGNFVDWNLDQTTPYPTSTAYANSLFEENQDVNKTGRYFLSTTGQSRAMVAIPTPLFISGMGSPDTQFLQQFFGPNTILLTEQRQRHQRQSDAVHRQLSNAVEATETLARVSFSEQSAQQSLVIGNGGYVAQPTAAAMMQAGGGGTQTVVPGDLIGVNLVRGDLGITAYGTVTHIDGDLIYGFGHPMDLAGTVSMPLYKAFVDAVVPRIDFSYKVGSLVSEIGSVVQDRKTAILGRYHTITKRVPVNLQLQTQRNQRNFNFEVASGMNYGPEIYATLAKLSFDQYETAFNRSPFAYEMKLEMAVLEKQSFSDKSDKVRSGLLEAQKTNTGGAKPYSAVFTNTFVSQPLQLVGNGIALGIYGVLKALKENQFADATLTKVDITLHDDAPEGIWQIDRVELKKTAFTADETIAFTLHVSSYREGKKKLELEFSPNKPLPVGIHMLNVATEKDFLLMDRQRNPARFKPENFSQFLTELQRSGRSDVLVVSTPAESPAYRFNDEVYPHLPFNAVKKLSHVPSTKKGIMLEYETTRLPLTENLFGTLSFPIEIESAD